MTNKVERTVREEEGKVFAITRQEKLLNGRVAIRTIEEEMTPEVVEQYLIDDKDQMLKFKQQEKDSLKKIKQIENRIKQFKGDRNYTKYKKDFNKYEMFEKIFELKFNVDIFCDKIKKEYNSYLKKRDTYKDYFVTMTEENALEGLHNNLEAFKDIIKESDMMKAQMKEVLKLIKK